MTEDLVDRILKSRQEQSQIHADELRAANSPRDTVNHNSDYLWEEIICKVERLINKYNGACPGDQLAFTKRSGSPPSGFDVNRQTFPVTHLSVWRKHPEYFQFSSDRTEESFAPTVTTSGRIDVKADNNGNVYAVAKGEGKTEPLLTPAAVAEYLLTSVIS